MKAFCITDVGQNRSMNQDFVFASETPVGNLPNLFVVADGMGGHRAGDTASRDTVGTLIESVRKSRETKPIKIIRTAVEEANRRVYEKSREDENLAGMGTTVVVAVIEGRYLYVANVGDSRLYLIRDDIRQITKDHSLVEEMVRSGKLKKEEARKHPNKNVITRAVGVEREVNIDFFDLRVRKGDKILLCSDGLSNMLEDSEICAIVKSGGDVEERARKLITAANQNGGKDNISVVLVEPLSGEVKEC